MLNLSDHVDNREILEKHDHHLKFQVNEKHDHCLHQFRVNEKLDHHLLFRVNEKHDQELELQVAQVLEVLHTNISLFPM